MLSTYPAGGTEGNPHQAFQNVDILKLPFDAFQNMHRADLGGLVVLRDPEDPEAPISFSEFRTLALTAANEMAQQLC